MKRKLIKPVVEVTSNFLSRLLNSIEDHSAVQIDEKLNHLQNIKITTDGSNNSSIG
jgi:hypothetical protein